MNIERLEFETRAIDLLRITKDYLELYFETDGGNIETDRNLKLLVEARQKLGELYNNEDKFDMMKLINYNPFKVINNNTLEFDPNKFQRDMVFQSNLRTVLMIFINVLENESLRNGNRIDDIITKCGRDMPESLLHTIDMCHGKMDNFHKEVKSQLCNSNISIYEPMDKIFGLYDSSVTAKNIAKNFMGR